MFHVFLYTRSKSCILYGRVYFRLIRIVLFVFMHHVQYTGCSNKKIIECLLWNKWWSLISIPSTFFHYHQTPKNWEAFHCRTIWNDSVEFKNELWMEEVITCAIVIFFILAAWRRSAQNCRSMLWMVPDVTIQKTRKIFWEDSFWEGSTWIFNWRKKQKYYLLKFSQVLLKIFKNWHVSKSSTGNSGFKRTQI